MIILPFFIEMVKQYLYEYMSYYLAKALLIIINEQCTEKNMYVAAMCVQIIIYFHLCCQLNLAIHCVSIFLCTVGPCYQDYGSRQCTY